jgi:uncharacterized protein YycO
MILDGEYIIEAHMMHGVRRVPLAEAMKGCVEVDRIAYQVPDAEAGLGWARDQVGKGYDWQGAFGLALSPDREWQDEGKWECFELVAATLAHAGREIFQDVGHVSGTLLLMIKP